MSEAGRVLDAEGYAIGSQPYLVQQVAAAALEELRRKRGSQPRPAAPEDAALTQARAEISGAQAQAAKLVREAEAKAEALLVESQARAEAGEAEARERGFQEGELQGRQSGYAAGQEQGEAAGKARYAESIQAVETMLNSMRAEKEAYFRDREALLVELALRVAAKVIHREVQVRPDEVEHLLRQAAQRLSDRSRVVVTAHPDDVERLQQAQAQGLGLQGLKQVEFLADDKMVRGGVRVASGAQTLDAALDSQLAEIARSLLEEAGRED